MKHRQDSMTTNFRWRSGRPAPARKNMNMNQVLANRASELLGGVRGMERKVHPNDDVNKSQVPTMLSDGDARCGAAGAAQATHSAA
ncbi:hypothetical protein ACNKHT_10315 [Shigella flexneri]